MSHKLWLFDLDNTLHNAGLDIFPIIERKMDEFLMEKLGLDITSIDALRQLYWERYGASVLGLVKHHAIRAHEFLPPVHDIPNLEQILRYERGLKNLLRRLPGRKILLTNAPHAYAHRVLRHLGIRKHFARHIPIEDMHVHRQLRPKPNKLMLRRLLAREGKRGTDCILVEDSYKNLRAAKALGIRTVWITQYLQKSHAKPSWVDVKVPSVRALPRQLARLR
jgi:putative hydrolase of the HAD superfamily